MNIRTCMSLGALSILAACGQSAPPELVGTLERDRIELKVESSEPIVSIHVADGQQGSSGDPVISQDRARAEALLAQHRAARDQVAARLAELVRGPRYELIEESRAQLQSAEVIAENARLAAAEKQAEQCGGNQHAEDIERYQHSPREIGLVHGFLQQRLAANPDVPFAAECRVVLAHGGDYREFALRMC